MTPTLLAASQPGADPDAAQATFTTYQMLYTLLNTTTEDIAVNILGGGWFVLVGWTIVSSRRLPAVLGWIGLGIGFLYLRARLRTRREALALQRANPASGNL